MKKHFLSICFGILIGLVAGSTTGAFAAVGDRVEAVFDKFTFIVNGEKKDLAADPLVYKGTTYLPVRVVSNLLGYDVNFKAKTKTLELVQGTESETVSSDGSTVQKEIDEINCILPGLKSNRDTLQQTIDSNIQKLLDDGKTMQQIESGDIGMILPLQQWKDEVADVNKRIKELETRKSELEAQLK